MTRFLAFGDSFTQGVYAFNPTALTLLANESYPLRLQLLLAGRYSTQAIDMINAGLAGEAAEQGRRRLPGVLAQHRPEVVLLMTGVNELQAFGAPGIRFALDAIESMVDVATAAGAYVLVGTLPPQRPGGSRAFVPEVIEPFNEQLRGVVDDEGGEIVDVHAAFGGDLSLLGADGLHPNDAGYQRMAEAFFTVIRENFEVQTTVAPTALARPR